MSDVPHGVRRWTASLRTSTAETELSMPQPVRLWRQFAPENKTHVVEQEVAEDAALVCKDREVIS